MFVNLKGKIKDFLSQFKRDQTFSLLILYKIRFHEVHQMGRDFDSLYRQIYTIFCNDPLNVVI